MGDGNGFAVVPTSMIAAQVNHRSFRVLVALLAHIEADGWSCPSNNRLAEVTGLDRRNVIWCLQELEETGRIRIVNEASRRRIFVERGGKSSISDNCQGSVKVTPGGCQGNTIRQLSDSVKVTPPGVKATLPPHPYAITREDSEEEERDERERERARGGINSTLADQVARILGAVESDGTVDPHAAGLLTQWVAGKSERAVLAAAHQVMARRPRDPVRYFLRWLESPLPDPDAVPATNDRVAIRQNGTTPLTRLSYTERFDARVAEKAAAAKARRAAQQGERHAGD